jgi:hypothetical protein
MRMKRLVILAVALMVALTAAPAAADIGAPSQECFGYEYCQTGKQHSPSISCPGGQDVKVTAKAKSDGSWTYARYYSASYHVTSASSFDVYRESPSPTGYYSFKADGSWKKIFGPRWGNVPITWIGMSMLSNESNPGNFPLFIFVYYGNCIWRPL